MEILNGMLIELNTPQNDNFQNLVILNKNAKNKSSKFAKLCIDEFLIHNKVDTATIENFKTCYNNTVNSFMNRLDYAYNIEQQSTQNFWYNTATSNGEFGDKDAPTLFIVYENYKKVFEKIIIYDETAFKINLDIDITIETLKTANRGYGLEAIIANGKLKKFITLSEYELLKIKINV